MQDSINSIHIKNIKGFSDRKFKFNGLTPNKLNIIVARNGFGKSTIATSLKTLNKNSIELNKDDRYTDFDEPEITIDFNLNNKNYIESANNSTNYIKQYLDFVVINSPVVASATSISGQAILTTKSIDLCKLYDRQSFDYKISELCKKNKLERCSKCFSLLEYVNDLNFQNIIIKNSSFIKSKVLENKINEILEMLNFEKSKTEIYKQMILLNIIDIFVKIKDGKILFDLTKEYLLNNNRIKSDEEILFDCIQIYYIFNDKAKVTKQDKYITSEENKRFIDSSLLPLNTTGRSILSRHNGSKETTYRLKLPSVVSVSNGERDLLIFAANLIKLMISRRSSSKPKVIVCDEIFDYLDGANLLFAQFFINDFITRYKNESKTFFIIMTHLSPDSFNTYVCKNKAVHYIDEDLRPKKEPILLHTLYNRENMSDDFKNYFDSKLIHFNIDKTVPEFSGLKDFEIAFNNKYTVDSFSEYINLELSNYINNKKYDPLAMCIALRILCEKYQYSLLPLELKDGYLQTHTTIKKTDYLINNNIEFDYIADAFSLFYNEAAHISEKNTESVLKNVMLRTNPVPIRNLVKSFLNNHNLMNEI